MNKPPIPRRQILAGFGTAATVTFAGLRLWPKSAVGLTRTMYLDGPEGVALRIDWRETYNGAVVEGENLQATRVEGSTGGSGPVLSLTNLMPGDAGSLLARIRVTPQDAASESQSDAENSGVRVSMMLDLRETLENGINEPEDKAGDTSPNEGELQEYVDMTVWYDVGVMGMGECNAQQEMGEPTIAEGTVASLNGDSDTPTVERTVNSNPGVNLGGGECLDVGNEVCIGLDWSLDSTVGNIIQGDSVTFDLGFAAEQCRQETAPEQ